jgi:diadenosine tetraphosphate (Ap4A) HIT family hydrolase
MAEGIDVYSARIEKALGADRRLPLSGAGIPQWEIFPFEVDGLRLKPVGALVDSEEPRHGEGDRPCQCTDPERARAGAVWEDEHWMLTVAEPSGAPVVLLLVTKAHYDFTTLPDDLSAQMGRIMVRLGAAMETLPSVARAHVSRWGDGGAHLHVFFIARPARMPQLRGTCMALWDDFLPPVPVEVRDENVRFVVQRLVASYGGHGVTASRRHGGCRGVSGQVGGSRTRNRARLRTTRGHGEARDEALVCRQPGAQRVHHQQCRARGGNHRDALAEGREEEVLSPEEGGCVAAGEVDGIPEREPEEQLRQEAAPEAQRGDGEPRSLPPGAHDPMLATGAGPRGPCAGQSRRQIDCARMHATGSEGRP